MIGSKELRECLSRFATGVAVVTTTGPGGEPVAVTVNSFSSVSLDPPLVLWSLDRRSGAFAAFTEGSGFAVHVLGSLQEGLSSHFARRGVDKFLSADVDRHAQGYPRLTGAHAMLVCERHAVHDAGDHVILLGRVLELTFSDDDVPLIFYRGGYRRLAA